MALAVGAVALTGCGSPDMVDDSVMGQIAELTAPAVAGITGRGQAAEPARPALSAEEMAARALAANPAPLILVNLESTGATQVMAMTGENGGMRTYMTPNEQALIMRGGMLVGTKGLGNDLSVAEVQNSASLIRARRSGQATRTNRYVGGDSVERPLPMTCSIATGQGQSFALGGTSWNATQVVENCQGAGVEVQNTYLVTPSGQIPVSRQWVSPVLGYVTIQTIRP
ncbi:YjbF family lipoprotein [Paracoccus aerodenitrificans]|uniref:YjbF family lipoprotein n=1 Tax=Paracoccus aerodenitrificans TaxID=3017781 RepID=UPI0022F0BAD5|nr:YjbF family lipoprotein [Paracoccus aerodenitrificans]WBU62960.1 YjbF family lipoprotein [Paracoccus aerodenitrificans]